MICAFGINRFTLLLMLCIALIHKELRGLFRNGGITLQKKAPVCDRPKALLSSFIDTHTRPTSPRHSRYPEAAAFPRGKRRM